jgi:hypothetical protein
MAILTWKQVGEIRGEYKRGVNGYLKISKKYGVCSGTIRAIIKGRTWGENREDDTGKAEDQRGFG